MVSVVAEWFPYLTNFLETLENWTIALDEGMV